MHVEYVDRLSVADLRRQDPELSALDLVPVSHIGSAEDLSGIADASMDFVVACHVLEHLEDPTRALEEISRVLREGGIFFCALPEPRVTFDREREPTTVEHLTRDHAAGRASRRDHFVDWVENVERHQPWWQSERPTRPSASVLLDMDYSIHFHVWRPDTFLDYLAAVRRENWVVFEVLDFAGCQPGVDDEFIFILRKGIAPVPATAPALANPWFNPALGADGSPPAAHPLGARQAVRDAVRAGRVATLSVTAAARRRLQQRRGGR